MIRLALEKLGYKAKPLAIAKWISSKYDKNVKRPTIYTEKCRMKKEKTETLARDNGADDVPTSTPGVTDITSLADAVKSVNASREDTLKQLRSAREYHLGQVEEIDSLLDELGFPQR